MDNNDVEIEGVAFSSEDILQIKDMFDSYGFALVSKLTNKIREENMQSTIGNMNVVEPREFFRAQGTEWSFMRIEQIRELVNEICKEIAKM